MTIKYTLYTETKGNLKTIAARYFEAFTLSDGSGFWKGTQENSTQITVIGSDQDGNKIDSLAEEIKKINQQEAVLVIAEPVCMRMV